MELVALREAGQQVAALPRHSRVVAPPAHARDQKHEALSVCELLV